jgi:alpha,alpha-trehalose-phosphate synthase [UDP-forming]
MCAFCSAATYSCEFLDLDQTASAETPITSNNAANAVARNIDRHARNDGRFGVIAAKFKHVTSCRGPVRLRHFRWVGGACSGYCRSTRKVNLKVREIAAPNIMENWTKNKLHKLVADRLRGLKLIAVSNREPYIHSNDSGPIRCMTPASGLTTAMDPILRASGGVWVAHGSGSADRKVVDAYDRVRVPPEAPAYTLRRVWLSKRIENEYYYGLANEGLWPLCHAAFHRPRFSLKNWKSYREANEIFANAVLEEANGEPAFVFIQDYHLALLPRMLKRRNPNLAIAQFWHIPWPNREAFRAFPWKEELLDGMLGADLLGFHVRHHCANFLDTIDRNVEALVDTEHGYVSKRGHVTAVRPFPISIDFDEHVRMASGNRTTAATAQWSLELGRAPEMLGIGIDRIDYTKGIPDRLLAIDRLLEEHPEYVGRLVFLQIGVPSRTAIEDYENLNKTLIEQVNAMNRKWGHGDWKPVVFIRRHIDQQALVALHLMADFCLVSSLHDGMNLVAKEFVASRIDGDGVLILSAFTGAARELTDAVIVNPFAVDEMAEAIHQALTMPAPERRRRMNKMRAAVSSNNIYRWAGKIVLALSGVEIGDPAERMAEAGEECAALAGTAR